MRKTAVKADYQFHIFDRWDLLGVTSLYRVKETEAFETTKGVCIVSHVVVTHQDHLSRIEEGWLKAGYEGVMLRHTDGLYKYGQSTENEAYLLKIKNFEDGEAEVIGFIEQETNLNPAEQNELGHTKRSSSKHGKVKNGVLGAFVVRDASTKAEFKIAGGPGLTNELRRIFWVGRELLLGKYVYYKYQKIGTQEAPRIPQYYGFRDRIDIAELEEFDNTGLEDSE